MTTTDVITAWTDLDARAALTADQLAQLPVHPAGDLDEELRQLRPEMTVVSTACTKWNSGGGPRCCC